MIILPPTFTTERLFIKPLAPEHMSDYKKYFVNYDVISELSAQVPWPYPENGVEQFLNSEVFPEQGDDRWVWGIFLKNNPDELIGGVDLYRDGKPENRGFWLGRPFWGQGLMTEAVEPVVSFAFAKLGFEKLILSNALGNVRSRRVKEKTGCRLLGVRPAKFVNPAYTQAETWELTKEAWELYQARK